jgi:hypothetical protein
MRSLTKPAGAPTSLPWRWTHYFVTHPGKIGSECAALRPTLKKNSRLALGATCRLEQVR